MENFGSLDKKSLHVTLLKRTLNDVETEKWTSLMFARSPAATDKSSIE
ncbi:hypothetical protein THTE_1521 [Thermogutta terrifontis]|uniref:Uncharacterized protein n=1 Tax=Thermogutta terrifontis TaxID=1331910 RepID=A0A286RDV9_9BACT|nr:hypothetical protein THTE_1521 [Thermogutta terrifontis]